MDSAQKEARNYSTEVSRIFCQSFKQFLYIIERRFAIGWKILADIHDQSEVAL